MLIFPNQKSKYFTQNVYLKIAEKKVPSNIFSAFLTGYSLRTREPIKDAVSGKQMGIQT